MTNTKSAPDGPGNEAVEVAQDRADRLDRLWREGCAKLPPACEHEFGGWRDFDDGRGGEQFCQKCGIGAMNWSMWNV